MTRWTRPARFASAAWCVALVACSGGGEGGRDAGRDAREPTDARLDAPRDASAPPVDGGPPRLVALSVTGASPPDGAAAPTLSPSFTPGAEDYYVRCQAGPNTLHVSMTASQGALTELVQPTSSASLPSQALDVTVAEGDSIVVTATAGDARVSYWVRCLPHDFPRLEMTPHPEAGAPSPGYYLVGNVQGPPGEGTFAMVLDARGDPLWYARQEAFEEVYDVDEVVPFAISFAVPFQVQALSPPSATFVRVNGATPDEHELRLLPSGDYLVFTSEIQGGVDLTGVTLPLPDGGSLPLGRDESIVGCDVVEVAPSGDVVWRWKATEHFEAAKAIAFFDDPLVAPDGGPLADPFHCNSIDVADGGDLLVSARNMDSVFFVERATGRVLWKMGGPDTSKDHATYVGVVDAFHRQHDARLLPGWTASACGASGQISVYDDETELPGPSRGVVYDVRVAADGGCDGGAGSAATVAWQRSGDVSVEGLGSVRVQADGARVIGWGAHPGLAFTEVDAQGRDLLDFAFPDGNVTYRAIKVPTTALSIEALRGAVGK